MIPKELHLQNILDTTVEELARLSIATADDWALIEKAAIIEKSDRWNFMRQKIVRGIGKGRELRETWLKQGKHALLERIWRHVLRAARSVIEHSEHAAGLLAKLAASMDQEMAEKEGKRKTVETEKARRLAATSACGMVAGDKLRAAMFVPYVVGRFVALRESGLVKWDLIDRAAAAQGVSWREFLAVEFVLWRIQLKGFCEAGRASCWRGSALCWWRQCGEVYALVGTWLVLNRRAAEIIEDGEAGFRLFSSTDEERAELMPIMEVFAHGATAAVDARDERCWKEARYAAIVRPPKELNPRTLLQHMLNELAQHHGTPGVDWSEIEAAAARKGRPWREFIGWALIRHFITYTGRCWWQGQIYDEVRQGEPPDLWAIVNQEARRVIADHSLTSKGGIPGWLVG